MMGKNRDSMNKLMSGDVTRGWVPIRIVYVKIFENNTEYTYLLITYLIGTNEANSKS